MRGLMLKMLILIHLFMIYYLNQMKQKYAALKVKVNVKKKAKLNIIMMDTVMFMLNQNILQLLIVIN
jgi:hypothetical protein